MKENILIKGNNKGLTILLDEDANFASLKTSLRKKIHNAKQYFLDAKVKITFTGRKLTKEESQELIAIITNNSNMEVLIDKNEPITGTNQPVKLEEDHLDLKKEQAIFHKGTLRSGQILEIDSSIIILGDVNAGAKVIARGNVIIIGALRGSVYTSSNEDTAPFVVALDMEPIQIKIGDIIGRSSDYEVISNKDPKMAYAIDERIYIESINKSVYKDILYM